MRTSPFGMPSAWLKSKSASSVQSMVKSVLAKVQLTDVSNKLSDITAAISWNSNRWMRWIFEEKIIIS